MNNYFGGCGYRRLPCQNEIELSSDENYQGYWEKRGYALYRTDLFTRVG